MPHPLPHTFAIAARTLEIVAGVVFVTAGVLWGLIWVGVVLTAAASGGVSGSGWLLLLVNVALAVAFAVLGMGLLMGHLTNRRAGSLPRSRRLHSALAARRRRRREP